MQEFNELPKADKFFKQIVDKKVESYIDTSQKVASQYMKQKNEAQKNAVITQKYLQDLKRQLSILKTVELTRIEGSGISYSQLKKMIFKYENLIGQIQAKMEVKIQGNDEQKSQDLQVSDDVNRSFDYPLRQTQLKFNNDYEELRLSQSSFIKNNRQMFLERTKKWIIWGLKSLELITVFLMILCVVKVSFLV